MSRSEYPYTNGKETCKNDNTRNIVQMYDAEMTIVDEMRIYYHEDRNSILARTDVLTDEEKKKELQKLQYNMLFELNKNVVSSIMLFMEDECDDSAVVKWKNSTDDEDTGDYHEMEMDINSDVDVDPSYDPENTRCRLVKTF